MGENNWASKQYTKIQDFVVINRLYRGYPDNASHADIVISEIMKLKKIASKQASVTSGLPRCPTCGKPEDVEINEKGEININR